jgi:hypothetical protein
LDGTRAGTYEYEVALKLKLLEVALKVTLLLDGLLNLFGNFAFNFSKMSS